MPNTYVDWDALDAEMLMPIPPFERAATLPNEPTVEAVDASARTVSSKDIAVWLRELLQEKHRPRDTKDVLLQHIKVRVDQEMILNEKRVLEHLPKCRASIDPQHRKLVWLRSVLRPR